MIIDYEKRNEKVLESFVAYCKAHPTQRFWQALRNWADVNFILVTRSLTWCDARARDTFPWEGRNG